MYNAIIKRQRKKRPAKATKNAGPGAHRQAAWKERQRMDCIIKQVGGHVEVYSSTGAFLFSADNTREAMEELAG